MKTLATGVTVLVVIIASIVFLLSSICTVTLNGGRFMSAVFALVSLGVIFGGIKLIGHLNRPE